MPDFEIGDRVRCTARLVPLSKRVGLQAGDTGVIVARGDIADGWFVRWDTKGLDFSEEEIGDIFLCDGLLVMFDRELEPAPPRSIVAQMFEEEDDA